MTLCVEWTSKPAHSLYTLICCVAVSLCLPDLCQVYSSSNESGVCVSVSCDVDTCALLVCFTDWSASQKSWSKTDSLVFCNIWLRDTQPPLCTVVGLSADQETWKCREWARTDGSWPPGSVQDEVHLALLTLQMTSHATWSCFCSVYSVWALPVRVVALIYSTRLALYISPAIAT